MLELNKDNAADTRCPLISHCLNDCYCTNLISQNTEAVVYYCGGKYEECEVYRTYIREN
jgi:hypothetical protein